MHANGDNAERACVGVPAAGRGGRLGQGLSSVLLHQSAPYAGNKLGWQQQLLRVDRIELLRSREAMGPDVHATLGWTAKQPVLKREDHLLLEESLRADTTQDHHLIAGVVIEAGAHRHGFSNVFYIAAKAGLKR